jgi:hypothetical protein
MTIQLGKQGLTRVARMRDRAGAFQIPGTSRRDGGRMKKHFTNSEVVWRPRDVTEGSTIDGDFSFGILTLRHGLIRF